MHKTPDEIKKGLERCGSFHGSCFLCPYSKSGDIHCIEKMEQDALVYIQQLEAAMPKWISVNEQLPKEFATVLIMRDDIKQACVGWLIGGCWSVPKGVRVTHWMPLPEPPKMDGGVEDAVD